MHARSLHLVCGAVTALWFLVPSSGAYAQVQVDATVTRVDSYFVDEPNQEIESVVTFEVVDSHSHDVPPQLSLVVPGGEVGGLGQGHTHVPAFEVGAMGRLSLDEDGQGGFELADGPQAFMRDDEESTAGTPKGVTSGVPNLVRQNQAGDSAFWACRFLIGITTLYVDDGDAHRPILCTLAAYADIHNFTVHAVWDLVAGNETVSYMFISSLALVSYWERYEASSVGACYARWTGDTYHYVVTDTADDDETLCQILMLDTIQGEGFSYWWQGTYGSARILIRVET